MSPEFTRRHWLKLIAAATATGCDTVVVNVENKSTFTADGIPPITETDEFYVYQCCGAPSFEAADWSCAIRIRGTEVATLTADLFDTLTPVELEHTLQCIGGNPRNPLINNAVWGGVPFREVLDLLGVDVPPESIDIRFEGADAYHTGVPVSDLVQEKLWIVWQLNGGPLPFEHGAPCRFLVQGRYGTKNVKWPVDIDFMDENYLGFWETTGWSDDATYRQNGFILQPTDGSLVFGPEVDIFGTAYAGEDPVTQVEISFDDGQSWQNTEIYYNPGPNIWTLWRYRLAADVGDVAVQIRVTTASGLVSQGPDGTGQSAGYDGGMSVRFEVRS